MSTSTCLEPLALERARRVFDLLRQSSADDDTGLALDDEGHVLGVVSAGYPGPSTCWATSTFTPDAHPSTKATLATRRKCCHRLRVAAEVNPILAGQGHEDLAGFWPLAPLQSSGVAKWQAGKRRSRQTNHRGLTDTGEGTYMSQILDILMDYCEFHEFTFKRVNTRRPDLDVLALGFRLENGAFDCFAEAREQAEMFLFYSYIPEIVPQPKRAQVALFLTRANLGLTSGCFELDLDEGRVRFRTGIDVENDRLTRALVEKVVDANLRTMDHYYPGMMAVMFGNRTPEEVIGEVEGYVGSPES